MIVLVILTEVIAFAAAEEHVACRETQMIIVFVLTEDFHAGIIVVGEVLAAYACRKRIIEIFVRDGPGCSVAFPVLAAYLLPVVGGEEGLSR